jgi:hypothetical protein
MRWWRQSKPATPAANASSSPNKKRMRQFGKVDIPQAFIAALRMDSD